MAHASTAVGATVTAARTCMPRCRCSSPTVQFICAVCDWDVRHGVGAVVHTSPAAHSVRRRAQALLLVPLFFIVRLRVALPLQLAHLALVAPPLRAVCAVATAPGAACGGRMCLVMVAQLVRASALPGALGCLSAGRCLPHLRVPGAGC